MSKLTPLQAREKHARNLKNANEDMRIGIEAVTEAPTLKAAAAKVKMKANINKALDDGKWERGLKRVDLNQWKTAMIDKGLPRVAIGIDASAQKVEDFYGEFLPFLDTVAQKVNKMPDVTLDDSINRMTTQIREVAKFKRS